MTDLYHQIRIAAPPAQVYAAVATETGMRGWWTRDTVMSTTEGGSAEFGFERRAAVFRMTVEALDTGRSVRLRCLGGQPEWTGTTLEWRIVPSDGGSTLSFEHRGWRALTDYCASCNSTWGHLMFKLKEFVESGAPNPQWAE